MDIGIIILNVILILLPIIAYIVIYEKYETEGTRFVFILHSIAFLSIVSAFLTEGLFSRSLRFFAYIHMVIYAIALFVYISSHENLVKSAREKEGKIQRLTEENKRILELYRDRKD